MERREALRKYGVLVEPVLPIIEQKGREFRTGAKFYKMSAVRNVSHKDRIRISAILLL